MVSLSIYRGSLVKLMPYLVASFLILAACSNNNDSPINDLKPTSTKKIDIKVTTYNLKWFGIGGTIWNRPEQEFRQEHLGRFIKQELPDSDIITFTEVVKTEALKSMLKGFMECVSYEGRWSRHQHIVTCFNPNKYRAEKFDNDYVIQDVDLGSGGLRPALQAKICHINGACFLQIIGLHLIAGKKSEARFKQIKKLRDELLTQTNLLPSIILGDLNSYNKGRNGLDKDDLDFILDILNETDYKFSSSTRGTPTYGTGEYARDYDHILVSSDIQASNIQVYEACKDNPSIEKQFIPYFSYRKYYSDHCPITAQLSIPNPGQQTL